MARSFGRNVLLASVSWLIPTAVAVVVVPITVRGLGDDQYGVMALVGALTGYLALLDLGLGQGIIRYLSMFVALGYGRAMRECLRAMLGWFGAAGLLGAVATWLMSPWIVGSLLKVPHALVPKAIIAFRLGGVAFALGMVLTVLQLLPEAFLHYGLVSGLNVTLGSISLVGPALLVSLGYGLVPVMWFNVGMTAVACLAWGAPSLRLLEGVPDTGPGFNKYLREFVGFAWTNAMNRIWSAVQAPTSQMIVGVAGGMAQSAYFYIPTMLSKKVTGLLYRMSTVLLPTGSQMAADGERHLLFELYERSSRLFFLLNASMTAAVVVFSGPLLRYWVGLRYADQGTLALQMLTLTAGLNAVTMAASQVNLALGRPKVNLAFSLLESVINLSTVYGLTVAYGITGTALSGLLGMIVLPFFLHYTHGRVFGIGTWPVIRDCYLRTSIAVPVVAVAAWFVLRPLGSSLITTLALVCITTVAGLIAAAVSGAVTPDDWAAIRALARGSRGAAGTGVESS